MTRLEIYKECVGEFGIDPAMVDEFVVSEYYNPIESGDPDEEVPVDVAADIRAEWMPIFANWVRQCKEKASNYPLPSVPSEAPEPVESEPSFWKEKTKARARAVVMSLFAACLIGSAVGTVIGHGAVSYLTDAAVNWEIAGNKAEEQRVSARVVAAHNAPPIRKALPVVTPSPTPRYISTDPNFGLPTLKSAGNFVVNRHLPSDTVKLLPGEPVPKSNFFSHPPPRRAGLAVVRVMQGGKFLGWTYMYTEDVNYLHGAQTPLRP